MQQRSVLCWLLFISFGVNSAGATIFGTVRGIVHDPQHRPVKGAGITLRSQTSDWRQSATTNEDGEFAFQAVPLGDYTAEANVRGFAGQEQKLSVNSGTVSTLHFQLALASVQEKVEVSALAESVNPESSTTQTTVSRAQIAETPGADRTNSLAMITDYVPGAYLVHDQLHVRGGHQVEWLVDGVPVPNTNIASNVGPQFDPKDIDFLEVQRGGYSSEYGDRAYGVFNVNTRSGFERNNQGEVVLGYGSYNSTNDQINFGSHTDRFAYYASVNGNRTGLGLETPTPAVIHDLGSGLGAFTSLIFNASPRDQVRFVASGRGDQYQIPNGPDDQLNGIRDRERERDAFANLSWVHTVGPGLLLTISPFYHFNLAAFEGGPQDRIIAVDNRASNYGGGQISLNATYGQNNAHLGAMGFYQRGVTLFGLAANDGSVGPLRQNQKNTGNIEALFAEDQWRATPWLTLNGGVRLTHFAGGISENAANPRIGAAVRIPRLNWVLRGFYGRYYQAPPLSTISGPLLQFALNQGVGFLPLRGERDEQREVGLAIPVRRWTLDLDYFRTGARNFFDHTPLLNSNIFFPVTVDHARIRGLESTIRSPRLFNHVQLHLAYSHQSAEGLGGVVGGLTDFSPPPDGFFYLDHDQRNTITAGFAANLPWKTWLSGNIAHGSGFVNGNGPGHLPSHTTVDFSLGKSLGENWSVKMSALNIAGNHYLLDSSNTFGGSHFADPRQISGQITYRFHY